MPDVPDNAKSKSLAAALIVPNAGRRRRLAKVLAGSQLTVAREFETWPSSDDLSEIALRCRVAIVDLDDDTEQALRTIGSLCGRDISMTVMASSSRNDTGLMRRSMQAGAREYLIEPLLPEAVAEAFARAFARHQTQEKSAGKTLVFVPSKGGVGVTTITANFALALTRESGAKVVVVDMDMELGEIALGLGMTATFSVADALQNPARLDREFLSTLLLRHSSGLAVLASPEKYGTFSAPGADAGRLFRILREEFDYVVVDAGMCHSQLRETMFDAADTIYLVTEITFPALRNAHRLISFLSGRDTLRGLEVVVNRFNSRHADIDEKSTAKALARPVNWRIPNCYEAARIAEDSGVPLAMEDSPITRILVQMARAACGKAVNAGKKPGAGFSFFGSKARLAQAET
jgi:pilus assembly protein CpaE